MKKVILLLYFTIANCLLTCAQVTITGTLYNSPEQKVYLMSLYGKVDSAVIDPISPHFILKADIKEESYFKIFYQKKGPFVLNQFVVLPGEHLDFSYNLPDSYDVVNPFVTNLWLNVSGSPFTRERINFFKVTWPYKRKYEILEKQVDSIRKNNEGDTTEIPEKLKQMRRLDLQFDLMARELLDTTKSNTNAGLMISFLKRSPNVNKDTINALLLALKARFPDVKYIQALNSGSFSDEQGLELNTKAPDINLKDIDGTAIDTKTISYKYLLIDFWASWCKPCREESPYLIKTYDKFQQNGFQILSLSIDANVNKWKEAIQTDGTSKFLQVIDTDAAKSVYLQLYKISSIPSNFLIDKNGIIVAKNLRGDELYKTIAKLVLSN